MIRIRQSLLFPVQSFPRKKAPFLIFPYLVAGGFLIVFCFFTEANALPEKKMDGAEFFERKIRPVLVEHCYECHSEQEDARKGGLLLDREVGWLEGGDTGKAIVPGQIGESLLIEAISHVDEDLAMPPKYKLEEEALAVLKQWVKMGAPGPAEDMGETQFSQLGDQTMIFEHAKEHWSFQPVAFVDPPEVKEGSWSKNPIDRFVFARMEEEGLSPSPRADKRTLTRRLSFDLTGLPPVEEELFEKETDALIEDLIASPRYGEHIARMWLDVARYADTASTYRADTKTPHYYPYAFTYRDYVIDAFNKDKPFDLFVKEQLAADLMGVAKDSPELAATGFIGVSPHRAVSPDFADDAIDATTRGLLGLTVSCARCHDHKFEPVPTADYYSLYGVFYSIEKPAPWNIERFPKITGYSPTPEQVKDYEEKRAAVDKKIKEAGNKKKKGNNRSLAETIEQTELAQLLISHDGAPVRAMSIAEAKKPVNPTIYIRGDTRQKGDQVPRRFLKVLDPDQKKFNEKNSGRLDLAEKIASPDNPLTARVYVNRVWGILMGSYLVPTPSDFGLQGAAPTNPELLDFLASEFVKNGWSTRYLIKMIVSSETYQQSSNDRKEMVGSDPENKLYWRANRKRLQIEELRDSLLTVSGRLDVRMHGRAGDLWGENYTKRRSIYGFINRFNQDPTLRNFDFPSPMQTQESRSESVVAPQALFLMNSPFVADQAQGVVDFLKLDSSLSREDRIQTIFQRVLQRPAVENEIVKISRFADIEENRKVNPWPLVAQSLCMSNEFLYVD